MCLHSFNEFRPNYGLGLGGIVKKCAISYTVCTESNETLTRVQNITFAKHPINCCTCT